MSATQVLFISCPEHVTPVFSVFKEQGIAVLMAEDTPSALKVIRHAAPAMIFLQENMKGADTLHVLASLQQEARDIPVIVFTLQGSVDRAHAALEAGARDYWTAPLDKDKVLAVLPQPSPAVSPAPLTRQVQPSRKIIGSHPAIRRVLTLARQVAPSRATVLISGESGTGKEMFARYLHEASDRRDKPFIAVNCAALPEHLLESELFGHEKGAFTGAIHKKPGKFELAHGGTLLLDEISEMDLGLQAKLLRVLQEGEIDRVGGTATVKVDVRVLATTNRAIEQSVQAKEFRQDLYYRLNVIPLKLPPLRERGRDIMALAAFFLERYGREYGFPASSFAPEAATWLMDYPWPGNVRELQNLMERAVLLAAGSPITPCHFLLEEEAWPHEAWPQEAGMQETWPLDTADRDEPDHSLAASYEEQMPSASLAEAVTTGPQGVVSLQEMERRLILQSLDQTAGNRTQASKLLGISVRTLRNKLNEYRKQGMDIE
ncbi:MAG: sigma-54-dependent Fis family transcriptional regulator [Desulfobacterales bacterium]|nr:MAG: sigma-54-dependent Fis family transcriptional regulator [Desulfobacterales bacterium]